VRFCRTSDGVRLAYATSGSGPPLVKAAHWLTHLDYDWASPVWSRWCQALSEGPVAGPLRRARLRAVGLGGGTPRRSRWTRGCTNLETVVDTLGWSGSRCSACRRAGPIALTYAARHPERVSHLVVYGTCGRSTWARADATQATVAGPRWGADPDLVGLRRAGFRQVYDARFLPDGPLETWRAFDELQRRSTSAENAYRLWRAFGGLDATGAARGLDVPTLILHSRGIWCGRSARRRTCTR